MQYLSLYDATLVAVQVKSSLQNKMPMYYISYTLHAETRYPQVEKLVYALVIASRKLRHYFQGREIQVMTN